MMSFHFYSVSLPNDFWAMNENTFFFSYKKKVRNGLQQQQCLDVMHKNYKNEYKLN